MSADPARRSILVAVLAACTLLASCQRGTGDSEKTDKAAAAPLNTTDPRWVSQQPPGAKIAVVFVHGIFGDTIGSWRADGAKKSFFDYLKEDPGVGDKLHTFAFGFTSKALSGAGGSLDIREAANKLHESLRYSGVLDYDAVVFAAHSMGGLIVMRELVNHPDLAGKVPLLALYATPQEGAEIADIGRRFLTNPALAQLAPADANSYLQQLSDDWVRLQRKPSVVCAYEKVPTDGVLIVPWTSSSRFCTEPALAIAGASHLSIVKPDRPQHESVVMLVNALKNDVIGKTFGAKLELPDFVSEGDHLLYQLRSLAAKARLVNTGTGNLVVTVGELSDGGLLLTPQEMPIQIPAEQSRELGMWLLYGATTNSYQFLVKPNGLAEQRVVVRIPDLGALKQQGAAVRDSVTRDLTAFLRSPDHAELGAFKFGDEQPLGQLSSAALASVERRHPQAPKEAAWLLTADLLASANLPQVAAAALRQAEAESKEFATTPAARHVASRVARDLGQTQVFANARTSPSEAAPAASVSPLWTSREQIDNAEQLAVAMSGYNAFRPYGLSLQGDVLSARGDKVAATRVYSESASLHPTPSIQNRLAGSSNATDDKTTSRAKTVPSLQDLHVTPLKKDLDSRRIRTPLDRRLEGAPDGRP